jgi:hypothetical protein
MKTIFRLFSFICICILIGSGCKPKKAVVAEKPVQIEAKNSTLEAILKAPINSADQKELGKPIYKVDRTYLILQNALDRFKDNAPFIEYLDGGKRERIWFSSSRADTLLFASKRTNRYQQVYFADRNISTGQGPDGGWGTPTLFVIKADNPLLRQSVEAFNKSTKGAATIANSTLILSSDQISTTGNAEFKDLWELTKVDGEFTNPKPLESLSNANTWESQPALSPNGKHLFFVSNRKVIPSDSKGDNQNPSTQMNIFYSFKENGQWRSPVFVKELYSVANQVTPHVFYNSQKLLFTSNRAGNYQIYESGISFDDLKGGYTIDPSGIKLLTYTAITTHSKSPARILINDEHNQSYPFLYFNLANKVTPRALYWSSDDPEGLGGFDLYGCPLPFEVKMNVVLADRFQSKLAEPIPSSILKVDGFMQETRNEQNTTFLLYSHLPFTIFGGSTGKAYDCIVDAGYIHIGYSEIKDQKPFDKAIHTTLMSGATVKSQLTARFGNLPLNNLLSDTSFTDTVYITRAWEKKPACPGKLNIEPKYRSIPYFQTGYWEVNTSANLKRDLELLHKGFQVDEDNNYLDPTVQILRQRSDYESPYGRLFPVVKDDGYPYSIANASWIELHPNNSYWGENPNFPRLPIERMQGRKQRIRQYMDYAKQVDENLKNLTDTVKMNYIDLLQKHQDKKPQLLIEIFAVSDQREVFNCWYIGEEVQYRSSDYLENQGRFTTEHVKIVPPEVNETEKKIIQIKPCSIELNDEGDNGSMLGVPGQERSDRNTNLSRLRAWYGYREVYKRLWESEEFQKMVKDGKVALPDNTVSYRDADIIIITRGKREDEDLLDKKSPYPAANNPQGNGYFDFDQIRRIEIQTRLLISKDPTVEGSYCCDPREKK